MPYTPNNPLIPGDPYSYDLKWMVDEIKKQRAPEEEAAAAAASAEEAKSQAEAAALSASHALNYENAASNSANAAASSAQDANIDANIARQYADNIADPVSGIVTDWLADNITVSPGVTIDTSLTIQGAAADAEATGIAINRVKDSIYVSSEIINAATWRRGSRDTAGIVGPNPGFFTTELLPIIPASNVNIIVGGNAVFVFEFKRDGTFIQTDGVYGGKRYTTDAVHLLQDDTAFISLVIRENPVNTSSLLGIVNNSTVTGQIAVPIYDGLIKKDFLAITNKHAQHIRYANLPLYEAYIRSDTGASVYNTGYNATDFINVREYTNLYLTMPKLTSLATRAGVAFYDSNKVYLSGIICHEDPNAGWEWRNIDVPSGAYYMRTCFRATEISDFDIYVDDTKKALDEINAAALNTSEMLTSTKMNLEIFSKIGVIGDSISVGWALNSGGLASNRNTKISWPQMLARKFGLTAYNMGSSGITPETWFTIGDGYCYEQYQSAGECDAYIIGLGLNPMTLGTVSDINSGNYNLNGNTFYGQYARIIQMINAEHPNAKVICLTEPTPAASSYDTAIRTICALGFINAELLDLEVNYYDIFNAPEIIAEKQPDGVHYTPVGYALLADAMAYALNDYISANSASFKYVGVA